MIAETKMTKERMQERIAWVTDKIAIETKVKVGAENLAKVYGHGLGDKKALSNLYTKLVDSNTKINLLKVALQKYQIGLGVPVTDVVIDTKGTRWRARPMCASHPPSPPSAHLQRRSRPKASSTGSA